MAAYPTKWDLWPVTLLPNKTNYLLQTKNENENRIIRTAWQ